MVRYVLVAALAAALCACTPAQESGKRISNTAKKEYSDTYYKIKDMLTPEPPKNLKEKPAPSRYCYRVMQDIMCYRDPQPGAEMRLVGYQEPYQESGPRTASDGPGMSVEAAYTPAPPIATISPGMQTASAMPPAPSMPMRSPFIKPGPMATPGTVPDLKSTEVGAPPPVMTDATEYSSEPRGLMRKQHR